MTPAASVASFHQWYVVCPDHVDENRYRPPLTGQYDLDVGKTGHQCQPILHTCFLADLECPTIRRNGGVFSLRGVRLCAPLISGAHTSGVDCPSGINSVDCRLRVSLASSENMMPSRDLTSGMLSVYRVWVVVSPRIKPLSMLT